LHFNNEKACNQKTCSKEQITVSGNPGSDVGFAQGMKIVRGTKFSKGAAEATDVTAAITKQTFESDLRCLRLGGTLSSLGVYSGKLQVPYEAVAAGLGDYRIVTTLCPSGKERMRRLINLVQSGRLDPTPLLTHSFSLNEITVGYRVFGERLDGVMKVAIRP
jgi:threonine dehydrogenase-like Zn-dependent dehydrogenase